MELYVGKFIQVHPLPEEVRVRFVPFTWTELLARQPLLPEAREVIDTVKACGWDEGFVVPIHGPGSFIGIVSYCGTRCRRPIPLRAPSSPASDRLPSRAATNSRPAPTRRACPPLRPPNAA